MTKRLSVTNVTGYYSRVLSGIHLTLMFVALLQKDLFKEMWSLADGFFKQNYCHACHTRFAVVFPLPFCCVSLLFWARKRIRKLKQQRFWATDVNQKWTFCSIGQWFGWNSRVNRLYKRKGTQQYKFVSVKVYIWWEGLTSGWHVSLKNVFA